MRDFIIKAYSKAGRGKYALGAFNYSTSEILNGIWNATVKMKAPVIISNSEGERAFFGLKACVGAYREMKKDYPYIILHADHTKTFEEIKKVVNAGYPSVHFDGSELPYDENVRQTKAAVEYAHKHNVFVEGELGGIRGGSTTHAEQSLKDVVKEDLLTNPDQAAEFVRLTGVDSLAISVGNVHGLWKDYKKLDFDRIKRVKEKTGKFLVLHGGSGINAADFRKAIDCGVNKININTELRIAYVNALIKGLHDRTDDVPYHYLGKVSEAVGKIVEEKIIVFRAENKI